MKENEKKFECGLTLEDVKRLFNKFESECGYNLGDYDLDTNFIHLNKISNKDLIIVVDLETFRVFKYEGNILQGIAFRLNEIYYLSVTLETVKIIIDLKKALNK